jgi:hypothetical protein
MTTKFKYNGVTGHYDIDLIQGGFMSENDRLTNGQEIELEDDAKLPDGTPLIPRLQANGLYEEVKKGRGRPKQEVKQTEGSE